MSRNAIGFVLYPESAPANWLDILQATGLQCAISPLHDKDLNPMRLSLTVIACYSGPTSYSVVRYSRLSLAPTYLNPWNKFSGYYRYLTHKDSEKAQYSELDIRTVNGFNM